MLGEQSVVKRTVRFYADEATAHVDIVNEATVAADAQDGAE